MFLTVMPFGVAIIAAAETWAAITGIATIWRMIAMTLVWIAAFALGTQLFWKVTDLLAQKRQ